MSLKELRPYALPDWHAMDDASASRVVRARNALALVQDLTAGQKRTITSSVELNQDELGDFLSLIIEELDTARSETKTMRQFMEDFAPEIRQEVSV